jgi:hypothetical protein
MGIMFNLKAGGCSSQNVCPSQDGCPPNQCPDFVIRRHDTRPSFKVSVEDCDGPLDLDGLVIEASMWALAKLKASIADTDTYFSFADNIGFQQVMMGDIIIMDRARNPEHMLVTGFDETNSLIRVRRAYHGTTASAWKKGTLMRIFRIMGSPAESEMRFDDVRDVDGSLNKDVLQASYLIYDWQAEDVCLPGCYWFEFKVLKMIDVVWYLPGGSWLGNTFTHTDGFFYTGTSFTDSSVKLSYDQIEDKYRLPHNVWQGAVHLNSDSRYYTGSVQNDGSVVLNKTGIPSDDDIPYNEDGLVKNSTWYVSAYNWIGDKFENTQNAYYTGANFTDSSVKLFYDGMNYSTVFAPWYGPVHLFDDGNWYTGTVHDTGSVIVDKIFTSYEYDDNGVGVTASIIPSFTDISLTPADFGCILGEGVEWVRRFPIEGEGFLVKITDSPTSEL